MLLNNEVKNLRRIFLQNSYPNYFEKILKIWPNKNRGRMTIRIFRTELAFRIFGNPSHKLIKLEENLMST